MKAAEIAATQINHAVQRQSPDEALAMCGAEKEDRAAAQALGSDRYFFS